MPVTTANFKNGMCIVHEGKRWVIIEFQHVKPGKGGAFVRTKLKELKSGRVVEYTFRAGEKFEDVRIETKKMQYLYNDGSTYYFMDNTSYEQIELDGRLPGRGCEVAQGERRGRGHDRRRRVHGCRAADVRRARGDRDGPRLQG